MIETGTRTSPALAEALPEVTAMLGAATRAAGRAHAPYSNYHVGAAVLDETGVITGGCNVESAAYGATICAERGAIAAAVADGAERLLACVTVTNPPDPASCCGICRQLLSEFGPDLLVVNASLTSDVVRWGLLRDWLPYGFALDDPAEADAAKGDGDPTDGDPAEADAANG